MDDTAIAPTFTDHDVLDEKGERIGKVVDLISDSSTLEPRWLVVDPGVLRSSHMLPVEGSYRTEAGDIVTCFSKDLVMHAPHAPKDRAVSRSFEQEVSGYYGIPD